MAKMKALLIFIASSIMYVSFAAEAAGIFKSVSGDVKIIKNSKNHVDIKERGPVASIALLEKPRISFKLCLN